MHIERMLQLADSIEKSTLPVRLTMEHFCRSDDQVFVGDPIPCGTACCIAGWACLLFGDRGMEVDGNAFEAAQALLGLTPLQSECLFYNYECYIFDCDLQDVTREQATAAIRRMVAEPLEGVRRFEPAEARQQIAVPAI